VHHIKPIYQSNVVLCTRFNSHGYESSSSTSSLSLTPQGALYFSILSHRHTSISPVS